MAPADEIKEQGIRFVQAGWRAVKVTAEKLPGADRIRGRDGTATKTAAPEYVLVEDPPDDFKKCYLSVLVWLVHFDDNRIDERELCEIQLQMTRLKCGAGVRRAVRSYLEDPRSLDGKVQIRRMLQRVPAEMSDKALDLKCSLMKDAIRVRRATSEDSVRGQPGIVRLAELLELGGDQVAFLEDACVQEEKILAGKLSDSQIKEAAKSMAAKATGVGVPIAAIYVSGSVAGLSAAGITSGLAALGLGGILGLSSMLTGIGVVIVAGGATYKAEFRPAPWDLWDVGVVALAVLVGALTDYLLVATPGGSFKGEPQRGSPLTAWMKEQSKKLAPMTGTGDIERNAFQHWVATLTNAAEKWAKVPYDVVSPKLGLTPNVHRLASLGHDPLLGLVFGVGDIRSSTSRVRGASSTCLVMKARPTSWRPWSGWSSTDSRTSSRRGASRHPSWRRSSWLVRNPDSL